MAFSMTPKIMGHLGLVSGMCDEIDLVDHINRAVGPNRRKVSVGHAVKAMVVNALGFTGRAMYLTPQFFRNRPTDLLVGDGIAPDDLNDDCLGTALDALFEAGLNETFFALAIDALNANGVDHRFAHLDTTSVSLEGSYRTYYDMDAEGHGTGLYDERVEESDEKDCEVVHITRGYSKDRAPDLNQVIVSLMTSYHANIPMWIQAVSGNASDTKTFAETIRLFREQFKTGTIPTLVMDSAFYSHDTITEFSDLRWVTRVPETVNEARMRIETADSLAMVDAGNGYHIQSVTSHYAGVLQRWLVVRSEQAKAREIETFTRHLSTLTKKEMQRMAALSSQEFTCEADAKAAMERFGTSLKYHRLDGILAYPEKKFASKGRPSSTHTPSRTVWKTRALLEIDPKAVAAAHARKGMFVIATNVTDTSDLSDLELLSVYKAQGVAVERGFRFLKDPLFFAESLFLNDPKRIMALIMVMGISLLVYSLSERKLRAALKSRGLSIRSQTGKPTDNPTIRWVFMTFEDVMLIEIQDGATKTIHFTNPEKDHITILECFGNAFKKCYCLP